MMFWGYKLLPNQSPAERHENESEPDDLLDTYKLSERLVRKGLQGRQPGGMPLSKSGLREVHHLNVIAIQRGSNTLPLDAGTVLMGNDILLIMSRPEDSLPNSLRDILEILPTGRWQDEYLSMPDLMLIEAAIAPRSHLAGQTLKELRFGQKFNAKVLAIWRHGRSIRTRLAELPSSSVTGFYCREPPKVLNCYGPNRGLSRWLKSISSTRMTLRGWLGTLIMVLTLSCAVAFPDLIAQIMLSGALGMVLIRILSMDEAYRSIDWRSLFLMAGMLPLGVALTKTGASAMFADAIISTFGNWGNSRPCLQGWSC